MKYILLFFSLLSLAALNKLRLVPGIKAGQTDKGKKATMSHTASLATDNKIYEGAFKQAGIKQTDSLIKAFGIRNLLRILSVRENRHLVHVVDAVYAILLGWRLLSFMT